MLCYAFRHAESTVNAGQGGGVNCSLTELGQSQADRIARRLSTCSVSAIFCSPYRRVIETALPTAKALGLPLHLRHELCEFHPATNDELAAFQPLLLDEVCRSFDCVLRDPHDDNATEWPPVDEGLPGVIARTRRFSEHLKHRFTGPDDVVAVFSHGSPTARLIDAWLTDPPGPSFRFIIDNASLNAMWHVEGVRALVALNDRSHLHDLPPPKLGNFAPHGGVKSRPPFTPW